LGKKNRTTFLPRKSLQRDFFAVLVRQRKVWGFIIDIHEGFSVSFTVILTAGTVVMLAGLALSLVKLFRLSLLIVKQPAKDHVRWPCSSFPPTAKPAWFQSL